MYESLKAVAADFNLYVVCFDDITYDILKKLNREKLVPIPLSEFEDEELLRIKPGRTAAEYCWTCSSSTVLYCLNKYKLESCAYVDADMYFYSNPERIWKEDPSASVFITLHNYSAPYDQSATSGKFCVQFVGFKNNNEGMIVLKDWRGKCIEWCFNRVEDGKFGDQKYLDEWPGKFKGVHVVKDKTAGLAPWNIQQFKVKGEHFVIEKQSRKEIDPVFFHFHGFKIFKDRLVSFTSSYYDIDKDARKYFYKPYAERLLATDDYLRKSFPDEYKVQHAESQFGPFVLKDWVKCYLYDVKNDVKNINAKFTNSRFKNNYTYKIKA
jgi:hypothetical protein